VLHSAPQLTSKYRSLSLSCRLTHTKSIDEPKNASEKEPSFMKALDDVGDLKLLQNCVTHQLREDAQMTNRLGSDITGFIPHCGPSGLTSV